MSVDARQTAQEPPHGHFWDNVEQDTTGNDAGPQIGPEGTMESLAGLRAYVGRHARMDEMTKAALLVYAHEIEREVEDGWVRKSKEHVVSHATVEVTPHIDWSHMADELDVFTQLVRGFAEQVEEDA